MKNLICSFFFFFFTFHLVGQDTLSDKSRPLMFKDIVGLSVGIGVGDSDPWWANGGENDILKGKYIIRPGISLAFRPLSFFKKIRPYDYVEVVQDVSFLHNRFEDINKEDNIFLNQIQYSLLLRTKGKIFAGLGMNYQWDLGSRLSGRTPVFRLNDANFTERNSGIHFQAGMTFHKFQIIACTITWKKPIFTATQPKYNYSPTSGQTEIWKAWGGVLSLYYSIF